MTDGGDDAVNGGDVAVVVGGDAAAPGQSGSWTLCRGQSIPHSPATVVVPHSAASVRQLVPLAVLTEMQPVPPSCRGQHCYQL